ncbi:MAG: hypothetical protein J6W40_02815 [Alphaproteobacteria bacterium]|nr:hypothetical protein [Alphaproteobacteria bacterium]
MAKQKEVKPAKRPKEEAFINATEGLRGLFASMFRALLVIPEPKNQR